MVVRNIIFALIALLGASAVILGFKGMRNLRFLNGTIFILAGVLCMGFSTASIYNDVRKAYRDDRVIETQKLLKEVQGRYKKTQEDRASFAKQLEIEYDSLEKAGIVAVSIPDMVHSNPLVRARIERISLLKRWIDICDEQLALDAAAIQSYEDILFYYKNLKKVGALQLDAKAAFSAQFDLEKVREEAKTQATDAEPLEVTMEELAAIVRDYSTR